MDLAAAIAPTTLARQRTLPVAEPLTPLFPEGALVRGRAVACRGVAATSLALALAAEATAAGAWLAVVDVPWLGVEAAAELGVPLQRMVRVRPGPSQAGQAWADLVAAVLDGFEVVVTRVPRRMPAAVARRVHARLQAREGVLLTIESNRVPAVGGSGAIDLTVPVDLVVEATACVWDGVERGWGRLQERRVTVASTGRRVPRPRRVEVLLPSADGGVRAVAPADGAHVLRSAG